MIDARKAGGLRGQMGKRQKKDKILIEKQLKTEVLEHQGDFDLKTGGFCCVTFSSQM